MVSIADIEKQLTSPVPSTATRTSHGFSLHATRIGRAPVRLGTLQSVRFGQSRQVDDEYEIEVNAVGLPIDQVPQTLGRREIMFTRFDTWVQILEEVFGQPELITIIDQAKPLVIREIWTDPVSPAGITTRAYQYNNVFMTDLSRELRVDGSRVVGTDVTFKWGSRQRII